MGVQSLAQEHNTMTPARTRAWTAQSGGHRASTLDTQDILVLMGSRGGAVVRALASHQCAPSSIPKPGATCGLSLLLVLALAASVFLHVWVLQFSYLLKNQHF